MKPTSTPVFQINTNFALTGRNGAQETDAQVPHQALRLQNARRAVREARPVRARQDGERGGGDGEKEKRPLSYLLRLNYRKAGLLNVLLAITLKLLVIIR